MGFSFVGSVVFDNDCFAAHDDAPPQTVFFGLTVRQG